MLTTSVHSKLCRCSHLCKCWYRQYDDHPSNQIESHIWLITSTAQYCGSLTDGTFTFDIQRAILEWWGDMIWPKKYLSIYIPTYLPTCLPAYLPYRSNLRELWPLRHLIRVMRRHDLTEKDLPTFIPTNLPTYFKYLPDLTNKKDKDI